MESVKVERWHTETSLLVLMFIASIIIWVGLIVSILGIIYALFILIFLMLSHVAFIAYVRGSAVRISERQFPDLHERIVLLSNRLGLKRPPEAYIMQSGGTLNALATRLSASNFIILYSDLLEACEGNDAARDMIIGHELGHIHAGHLHLQLWIGPALFVPFLGTAYSRAREYTCDRYGMALAGDRMGALRGLAILSAGAKYGPKVDLQEFVKQRESLNTGAMTLGKWLSTHPPLSERVRVLEMDLYPEAKSHKRGSILASTFVVVVSAVAIFGTIGMGAFFAYLGRKAVELQDNQTGQGVGQLSEQQIEDKVAKAQRDLDTLALIIEAEYDATGEWPDNETIDLRVLWKKWRPDRNMPIDPFDYQPYGYWRYDTYFAIFSLGPDGELDTPDDQVKWVEDE